MAEGDIYIRGLKKKYKKAHVDKAKKQQRTNKPSLNRYLIELLEKTSGVANGKG